MATLFDRLGGADAVRAAVDEFYKRNLATPELAPLFDETKLARLRVHQVKFMTLAFTGVPEDMDVGAFIFEKHRKLFLEKGLNAHHFDLVAANLVASLQHLGVAQGLIDEAMGVIAPLRGVFETGAARAQQEAETDATTKPVTLLDKLGGTDALSAVVGEMYTRLLADEITAPMFAETNMTRLKVHQIQFMKIAFTVVPDDLDVPKLLVEKHQRLFAEKQLNETHFDKVAEHFVGACHHLNVDQTLIDEAVSVIAPLRSVFENTAKEYAAKNAA